MASIVPGTLYSKTSPGGVPSIGYPTTDAVFISTFMTFLTGHVRKPRAASAHYLPPRHLTTLPSPPLLSLFSPHHSKPIGPSKVLW